VIIYIILEFDSLENNIMPVKKGKGGAGRRKAAAPRARRLEDIAKNFTSGSFEVYGKVTKVMGNRRFAVNIQQHDQPDQMGQSIICSIRGSYRARISTDSYVLVKLYDFNTSQGQIIDSYSLDEIHALKSIDKWDFPESLEQSKPGMDIMPDFGSESESDSESESESSDTPAPTSAPASYLTTGSRRSNNLDIGMDLGVDVPEMLESEPAPAQAHQAQAPHSKGQLKLPVPVPPPAQDLTDLDIDAI